MTTHNFTQDKGRPRAGLRVRVGFGSDALTIKRR
jgi:hypothetical protein